MQKKIDFFKILKWTSTLKNNGPYLANDWAD